MKLGLGQDSPTSALINYWSKIVYAHCMPVFASVIRL